MNTQNTIPAPSTLNVRADLLPFRIAYRLRLRRPVAYGIRYGKDAEQVRTSLLAALRETSDTAVVLSVEDA